MGQKIVYALLDQPGVEVVATARGANRLIRKTGYTYAELDLTASAAMEAIISHEQPDVVIHCAALTQVDYCQEHPEECEAVNYTAVKQLKALCDKHKAFMVFLSTDFVFDGSAGPYKEGDTAQPLSVYGKYKLMAEEAVLSGDHPAGVVRTILVYGITDGMSRSNIVLWAKKALESGQPINVVNDQYRMPTLAEDLATACISMARQRAAGIFHISGKDYMSVYEIVQRVAAHYKLSMDRVTPVTSEGLAQAAPRPLCTGFVLDKAAEQLAYAPHSFEEGMAVLDKQIEEQQRRQ